MDNLINSSRIEYKVVLGVVGILIAFPAIKLTKLVLNTIITLASPRKGSKLASSFAFYDLFAPGLFFYIFVS